MRGGRRNWTGTFETCSYLFCACVVTSGQDRYLFRAVRKVIMKRTIDNCQYEWLKGVVKGVLLRGEGRYGDRT